MIQDLKEKNVYFVVLDELPAKQIINNNPELIILDGELTNDSYGMVVKKDNQELLDTINKVLERLKNEGMIDEFIINHTTK